MLDEFQRILNSTQSPSQQSVNPNMNMNMNMNNMLISLSALPTLQNLLSKTQDLILEAFQEIFVPKIDMQFVQSVYEQIIGKDVFKENTGHIAVTAEQQVWINYRLLQIFIAKSKQRFVDTTVYQSLQEQTQKVEAMVRSHVKLQQEMKMYIEFLELKVENLQKIINSGHAYNNNSVFGDKIQGMKRQLHVLQLRQGLLEREKISLMKKNQKLNTEIAVLSEHVSQIKTNSNFQSKEVPSHMKHRKQSPEDTCWNSVPMSQNVSRYFSTRNSPARKSQIYKPSPIGSNSKIKIHQHQQLQPKLYPDSRKSSKQKSNSRNTSRQSSSTKRRQNNASIQSQRNQPYLNLHQLHSYQSPFELRYNFVKRNLGDQFNEHNKNSNSKDGNNTQTKKKSTYFPRRKQKQTLN